MSKRNIRAKSGKQLYLNSVFNRGILYTSGEIPEGYSKILDNLDVTPSGDAITPRAPFFKTNYNIKGISKYTYPMQFQGAPDKQFYINFANTIDEETYVNNIINNTKPDRYEKQSINVFSRSNNNLNTGDINLDTNNNPDYNPDYIVPQVNEYYPSPDIEGTQIYFDNKYVDIKIVQQYTREFPYLAHVLHPGDFRVIDADTVVINNVKYRLTNINAPEKGYKWYEYGKQFMNNLLTMFSNVANQNYFIIDYGKDNYERTIADIAFVVQEFYMADGPLVYLLSLSSIIAAFGYAKLEFLNNDSKFYNIMIDSQKSAQEKKYGIWGEEIDPLYPGINNIIVYDNLLNSDGYNKPKYLEVVAIKKNKRINFDTETFIDKVMFSYIDYMDSIAFIGRLIIDDKIYYKGIMYLKYEKENNVSYFKITLPPNQLNGEYVNIANATSNGYNLLNKNPINTDNMSDKSLMTSCLGIIVTDTNNYNRIITQTIPGNNITLRAIMNETYYPINFINNLTYTLHYDINGKDKKVDIIKNKIYIEPDYTDGLNDITLILNSIDFKYKDYDKDKLFNYKLNNNNVYNVKINDQNNIVENKITNLPIGGEGGTVSVSYSSVITKDNIFKYIILEIVFSNNLFEDLFNNASKQSYLISKWEVADYGSDNFKLIDTFKQSYEILQEEADKTIRTTTNNDTINYKINSDTNLMFKFTIVPQYIVSLNGICTIKMSNKIQENYAVYPLLKVSTSVEYVDKENLTTDLNIKDATRIGMFNRQVYLYGPYLKTNTIFFSKFEEPWYFSFPYYAVNTPERINYCYEWNSNLVLFGEYSIWLLKTDGTVNESTIYNIYDKLSIHDIDIDLVTTVGNNLIFFNNNNGYIAVSNKYYNDPTKINIYKLTENINNCLEYPKYLYRSLSNTPLTNNLNDIIRCSYKIYVDNDYIIIINNMFYNQHNLIVFYRYNQLYKYWSTYSINAGVEYISSPYVCEPNFGAQYIIQNNDTFNTLYLDASKSSKMDYGTQKIISTLDTGFLSIDPLNDKRFKNIILDLNNIQKDSIINIYMNFFIDGVPIVLSNNNSTAEFEYTDSSNPPVFKEGDCTFKYVLNVDSNNSQEQPYGTYIDEQNYSINVQGRNQLCIPVFGKGRLPSIVFKIDSNKFYEIVGYSIIYKEKNINIRR